MTLILSQLIFAGEARSKTFCTPGERGCETEESSGRVLLQHNSQRFMKDTGLGVDATMLEKDGTFVGAIAGANLVVHADSPAAHGEVQDWIIMQDGPCSPKDMEQFESSLGDHAVELWHGHGDIGLCEFVVRASLRSMEAVIRKAGGKWSSSHTSVETDSLIYLDKAAEMTTTSPSQTFPWNLDRIDDREGLDGSYDVTPGGDGVSVFVVDTGIRDTHKEFEGRAQRWADVINRNRLNLLNNGLCDTNPSPECALDDHGHGTHCAGTVAGKNIGVAPKANVLGVKVFNRNPDGTASGTSSEAHIALDLIMSIGKTPAVVSMSLGGSKPSLSSRTAVEQVVGSGIAVVVAAGNSKNSEGPVDACTRNYGVVEAAITVGSTNKNDQRSSFSNYGSCVDIFAPGSDIRSASHLDDGWYVKKSGTSMATPAVAGAVARMLSHDKGMTPEQVRQQLKVMATKDKLSNLQGGPNRLLFVKDSYPTLAPTPSPPAPPAPPPGEACLTSTAVLRTLSGTKSITTLSTADTVDVFELAGIGEDDRISSQDLLGIAKGRLVSWASFNPNATHSVLEFTYGSSNGTLQVTKSHYLMVKGKDDGVVLKQAQQIGVGDYLAAVPAKRSAGVSWRMVLGSRVVTATGLYMPVVMSDAGPGDVLVLADGVLVPIYAQYGGLTPSQAHQVFVAWEMRWQSLLRDHPCLDQVPRHHKTSIAVEMVRDFSKQHPGQLMKEELHPTLMLCHMAREAVFQEACPELAKVDTHCNQK